jgi:hypothetical protein
MTELCATPADVEAALQRWLATTGTQTETNLVRETWRKFLQDGFTIDLKLAQEWDFLQTLYNSMQAEFTIVKNQTAPAPGQPPLSNNQLHDDILKRIGPVNLDSIPIYGSLWDMTTFVVDGMRDEMHDFNVDVMRWLNTSSETTVGDSFLWLRDQLAAGPAVDFTPVLDEIAASEARTNTHITAIETNILAAIADLRNRVDGITVKIDDLYVIVNRIDVSVGVDLHLNVDKIFDLTMNLQTGAEMPPEVLIPGQTTEMTVDPYVRYPVSADVYDIEVVSVPPDQTDRESDPMNLPGVGIVSEIDVNNTPFSIKGLNFQRQRVIRSSIHTAGLLFNTKPATVLQVTPYMRQP